MIFLPRKSRVFVYSKPIDMRWGFEKLSYLIRVEMSHDLDLGDLFIFLGNNRRRLKGMCFDGSGLIVFCKRTEEKSFMNVFDLNGEFELTRKELQLLVHGSVLRKYSLPKI